MDTRRYDYFFRILLVGDRRVGKTSLLVRFIDDAWTQTYSHTSPIDMRSKFMDVDDKVLQLQLWDVTEITSYRDIRIQGILLLFDCANKDSMYYIEQWLKDNKEHFENAVFLLVGTKCDLVAERVISKKDVAKFASKSGLKYIEVSSKTSENVEKCFDKIFRQYQKSNYLFTYEKNITSCTCLLV